MMTSDLALVTSKVQKTEGVLGAHGLGKLKHLCHELFALGGVPVNVVHECRVFSGLRRPFDVGQVALHAPQPGGCSACGAEKRASAAGENTLHSIAMVGK